MFFLAKCGLISWLNINHNLYFSFKDDEYGLYRMHPNNWSLNFTGCQTHVIRRRFTRWNSQFRLLLGFVYDYWTVSLRLLSVVSKLGSHIVDSSPIPIWSLKIDQINQHSRAVSISDWPSLFRGLCQLFQTSVGHRNHSASLVLVRPWQNSVQPFSYNWNWQCRILIVFLRLIIGFKDVISSRNNTWWAHKIYFSWFSLQLPGWYNFNGSNGCLVVIILFSKIKVGKFKKTATYWPTLMIPYTKLNRHFHIKQYNLNFKLELN